MTRAGGAIQLENDEAEPFREAEVAVVFSSTVLLTVAVFPDAVALTVQVADPTPPATASSSVSLSSIYR